MGPVDAQAYWTYLQASEGPKPGADLAHNKAKPEQTLRVLHFVLDGHYKV